MGHAGLEPAANGLRVPSAPAEESAGERSRAQRDRVAVALTHALASWLEHRDARELRLALLDLLRELEVSPGDE